MDTHETTPQATPSPEGMIGQVLGNPDTVRRIGEILNGIRDTAPSTEVSTSHSQPAASGGIPTELLSNPAFLEQLPKVMQMLKPMMTPAPSTPPESHNGEKPPQDCRRELLLTLKPFLSPQKRNAVDTILRLSGLSAVLRQL